MIARRAADRLLPCCAQLLRDYGRRTLLVGARSPLVSPIDAPLVGASQRHCAALVAAKQSGDDLRQNVATAEFYF
ncbi:hypothetical protein F511_46944 [Dorcoceras hygrometricum]|uniref:Uncharacterized protein n=1 Tax=Dorcoceras hygrometricum TaxID=472368 RepID=A0A2Z6ZS94_9LAMI|nr:hypothetical protein F511_46944 [Dorcoceras hygrometricum]